MDKPIIEVPGERYRKLFTAAVVSLLHDQTPPVKSKGERFYNVDYWTARIFISEMCRWAKQFPKTTPTKADIRRWIRAVEHSPRPQREIVLAKCPDRMPLYVANGFVGGGYHEALHTLLTCRRKLDVDEMAAIVLPRWCMVPNWAPFHQTLQSWENIAEDIRIERCGTRIYPGIEEQMLRLQDFILSQEKAGDARLRAHGKTQSALTVITGTYRDLGFGYDSPDQQAALEGYVKADPKAVKFVVDGPLTPILKRNIGFGTMDDLGSLKTALDIVIQLHQAGAEPDKTPTSAKGQPGDGKQNCPQCGADPDKLVVRPKPEDPNQGTVTCTECGFQQEVKASGPDRDMKKNPPEGKGQGPKGEAPGPKGDGDGSGSSDKDGKPGDGKGEAPKGDSKKEASGDKDGKGKPGGEKKDGPDGSGDSGKSKDGEGNDGDESSSNGKKDGSGGEDAKDGKGDKEKGKGDNFRITDEESLQEKEGEGGTGADLSYGLDNLPEGNDFSDLAKRVKEEAEKGMTPDLLDNNSALAQVIKDSNIKDRTYGYQPPEASSEMVTMIRSSSRGAKQDQKAGQKLLESVRSDCAVMRVKFRKFLHGIQKTRTYHGVNKGRRLSNRRLVQARVALRAGEHPKRPYKSKTKKKDTSLALLTLVDQSSSVASIRSFLAQGMLMFNEPLDPVKGASTMAIGFRRALRGGSAGTMIDVFKRWEEKTTAVLGRFACTKAQGGTPMADGLYYALVAIRHRPETHRIILVVTDGKPNSNQVHPMQRLIKEASAEGILVVGVGIGSQAMHVRTSFPRHIWVPTAARLATEGLEKLDSMVRERLT